MVVYLKKSLHSLLSVFKKKAGPKGNDDQKRFAVHYSASQHHQENVFIEGSRPQYLQDLHTEAQEGLKIQQQEEHKNEANLPDDETVVSTDTLYPEQDSSSKDRGSSPESRSTIRSGENPVLVSDRPVLTRQGSTFKPLNPVKRFDRSRRKNRRTTIMGIPNQVQKELALHRSSTSQTLFPAQLNDQHGDSQSGVVVIPTVDGGTPVANKEGARVHLSELEAFRDEEQVRKHLQFQSVFNDEQSNQRPKSLAVPGMATSFSISPSVFTFLQEPQGPVMSISPQATYLSTIIPNAVLPASVEVIKIDRSASRNRGNSVNHSGSVRTVSKSSLASGDSSGSPLLPRRSDGDCSQTKTDPLLLPSSASGSNWSESQSSKTIISNSSPVSSRKESPGEDDDELDLSRKVENPTELRFDYGEQAKNKGNSTRNLSIVKTKQPPAPPQRTNSLHGKKISEDSRIVVFKDLCDSASEEAKASMENEDGAKMEATNPLIIQTLVNSSNPAGGSTEPPAESRNSSPPLQEGKFERTMSPSSGYSSQSGTPTLSPKELSPTSPDKPKKKPVKPERSVSRTSSSAASPSSSLTSLSSGTSELANPDASTSSVTPSLQGSSIVSEEVMKNSSSMRISTEARELLNIPPPPKIKAPCPPPPEAWAHNKRTVDLLCRSSTDISKVPQKPAQIHNSPDNLAETKTEKKHLSENMTNMTLSISETSTNKETPKVWSVKGVQPGHEVQQEAQDKEEASIDAQKEQTSRFVEIAETSWKKDPPPVKKKPTTPLHRRETENQMQSQPGISITAPSPEDNQPSQNPERVVADPSQERDEVSFTHRLSVDVPKISKISPPPTPPPAYQPTPPLQRKSSCSPPSTPPNELQIVQEEFHIVEPSWPPPPPPLAEPVYDGGDDMDFPPPPPLLITEGGMDEMDNHVTDMKVSEVQPGPSQDVALVLMKTDEASNYLTQTILSSAENPSPSVSPVAPLVPTCGYLKRNSLKFEEQCPPPPPVQAPPPPPTENVNHEVNFRRPPNGLNRDTKSKELLLRHKSTPIPKEDANIPLVTPSLLQMVRLRSVSMTEDQIKASSEVKSTNQDVPVYESFPIQSQESQSVPQKPIRKSLSQKSPPHVVNSSSVTVSSPSLRLQEAIRMKTAAMSSRDGFPSKIGVRSPTCSSGEAQSLKLPEGIDTHKSPASTASFIFSRSTKKVIIETTSCPDAQAALKQSLAAELMQVSDQVSSPLTVSSNGRVRGEKVPPPVAKKPPGTMSPSHDCHSGSTNTEVGSEGNGAQYASIAPLPETTTRITADTIETLF